MQSRSTLKNALTIFLGVLFVALAAVSCKPERANFRVKSANFPDNSALVIEDESGAELMVRNLNNTDTFSLSVAEPRYVLLRHPTKRGDKTYWMYLDGGQFDAVLDYNNDAYPFNSATSPIQQQLMEFERSRITGVKALNDSLAIAKKRFDMSNPYATDSNKNSIVLNERVKRLEDRVSKLQATLLLEFARKNPSYESIPFLASRLSEVHSRPEVALAILDATDNSVGNSKLAKQLRKDAEKTMALLPGATMPLIAGKDRDGNAFSDANLKKLNLVICYVSYSQVTRAAHANLVLLHNRYKDKGVAFFGIAFDKRESYLRKVEKMDGLMWPNYTDTLGAKSPNFVINNGEIPYLLIVDQKRKILSNGITLEPKNIMDELDDWLSKK